LIEINIDAPDIADIKARLGQFSKRAHVVQYRAVNRTLSSTKTDIAKQVSLRYIIKQKTVKDSLTTIKATSRNPTAFIKSKGNPIPLINFKVDPMEERKIENGNYNPRIYKARVLKHGSRLTGISRMFYVKGQLLQRPVGATRRENENIKNWLKFAFSVPQMIGNEKVYDKIKETSIKKLKERVDHEIEYELRRLQN
jgi:hypothetical protein